MIDPTKITPEKLAEMNDSLITDNNYLRVKLKAWENVFGHLGTADEWIALKDKLDEAVATLRAIRDASSYNTDELAQERWVLAELYLDKHPEFGCYFDGKPVEGGDRQAPCAMPMVVVRFSTMLIHKP